MNSARFRPSRLRPLERDLRCLLRDIQNRRLAEKTVQIELTLKQGGRMYSEVRLARERRKVSQLTPGIQQRARRVLRGLLHEFGHVDDEASEAAQFLGDRLLKQIHAAAKKGKPNGRDHQSAAAAG